jgi:hypothetical protein
MPEFYDTGQLQAEAEPEFFAGRFATISPGSLFLLGIGNLAFAIFYTQIYMTMAQFWGYLGYGAFGYGSSWPIAGWLIVLVAGFFVPLNRRDIGAFIVTFTFYILYVPCILSPFIQGFVDFFTALMSGILLGISFVILSVVVRPVRDRGTGEPRPLLGSRFFWLGLLSIWLMGNLFVLYVFRGNLRFASFSEVYDQRFEADLVAGSAIAAYAIGNLSCAVNPLVLALGLKRKSVALVLMGIASQLLLYSTSALKAILVATMMIVVFHVVFSDRLGPKNKTFFFGILGVAAAGILIGPYYTAGDGIFDQLMSLIYQRTLTTPGMLYGTYLDFFSKYPLTYLSHVNVVKWIIPYPYGELQIGQVVGNYITPAVSIESLNTNASYLATDGLAAFGLPGIMIATAISAFLFRLTTAVLEKTDRQLVSTALVAFLTYLSNVSIFTALLSYGGILVIGLLWLVPRSGIDLDRGPRWHLI